MVSPQVYVSFPGTARSALEFYAEVFGGELQLFTFEQFSRSDGPADAIAHAVLTGPVSMSGSDAGADDEPVRMQGFMLSLLGHAEPEVLHRWFDRLAEGGEVRDPLALKPWGAHDGQVIDRHGLHWLLGYETDS